MIDKFYTSGHAKVLAHSWGPIDIHVWKWNVWLVDMRGEGTYTELIANGSEWCEQWAINRMTKVMEARPDVEA